ncbi:MAG: NAD(P)/FAD-dependent oxidoreductase [Gaiellales bacterium]
MPDAVVVGAGPNGLAAAIELARAGRSVLVCERSEHVGGGTATAELTLPGYRHDVCSAIHPLAVGSPFLRTLPLAAHGLEMIQPEVQAAHPLDGGRAAVLLRSVEATASGLGGRDGAAYAALVGPFAAAWDDLAEIVLGAPRPPRHPLLAARFAWSGMRGAVGLANATFRGNGARSLFAGMGAHSMRPLDRPPTAAFALVLLALGHAAGWPVARGGSQAIAEAMAAHLRSLGGEIRTGHEVRSTADLPRSRAVLFDVTPRQLLAICGGQLPRRYRAALGRYRYGPGVFKIDYALSAPVPWLAEECRRAGTVHVGGALHEIAAAEAAVARGGHPQRPYVLVAQQSLVDTGRAPAGCHTLWAYCHVPNGSTVDMTAAIEAQIERFAPGFCDVVLARSVRGPAALEADNPNYVGGDITGGAADLRQVLARPVLRLSPYATPNPRFFLCSSSTPPGGGVHGMCGRHAARAALRGVLR